METKLTFNTSIEWNESAEQKVVEGINGLQEKIEEAWRDPFATFTEQAAKSLDDLGEAWEKTLGDGGKKMSATLGSAVTDSISPLFDGEMDKVEEIWDKAWENMADVVDSVLNNLLKDAFNELGSYVGGVFKDLVISPATGWLKESLDIKKGLGDLLKTSSSASNVIGGADSLGYLLGGGAALEVGDLVLEYAGQDILGEAGAALGDAMSSAITEAASNFSGIGSDVAALNEVAVSPEIAAVNDEVGMGGSEFMSSIGGGTGLMAAGAGLLAFDALVRFMPGGDPEGVVGGLKKTIGAAFGLTELDSMTAEQAALKAESTQDYFGRLAGVDGSSFLSTDAAEAGYGMEVYAGVMGLTPEEMDLVNLGLSGLNEQMEALQLNLEEATRLGDDEWAASLEQQQQGLLAQTEQLMAINHEYGISVEGLGQQNAAMLSLSTASEQMAISLNNLGLAYENSHDHKMDEAAAASDLVGYYREMAAQVEALSEGSVVLGQDAEELVGRFLAGQVTSEQFAESMQKKLLEAMQKAQEEGKLLADQMNEIADAIESIPTEWSSTVVTNYQSHGDPPVYSHSGGLILHSGGRAASALDRMYGGMTRYHSGAYVSRLAQDEVPAVLQRGEFVVRRDSVNASTLPSLKAINASGKSASGGGDIYINAPLINIEGNLIGDEDSKEDLVREIETKLRSLANSRFKS